MFSFRCQLDHVVVAVHDLDAAIAKYRKLGFSVKEGGINGPVKNALIPFNDGSYIELLAARSGSSRRFISFIHALGFLWVWEKVSAKMVFRFLHWLCGRERICDWCLHGGELELIAQQLSSSGLTSFGPHDFERQRPDGVRPKWRLLAPAKRSLPFLIEDITDRSMRVGQDLSGAHSNRVVGISKITLGGQYALDLENTKVFLDLISCVDGFLVEADVKLNNSIELDLSKSDGTALPFPI